jgi:hypothetical protein
MDAGLDPRVPAPPIRHKRVSRPLAPLLLEPRSDVVVAPHALSAVWSSELRFVLCDVGRDGRTRRSAGPSR